MLLGTLKSSEESLFYNLWFIFQRFRLLLLLLQLGVSLPLISLVTCNPPTDLVTPHRPSFNSPLPPAYWFGKALASLLNLFFFWKIKSICPIQCRLNLLVSQRPCKLLIQIFAVTLRWKESHLAHSTPSCLNSSTQFIRFSYKIVISFKFAWSKPRKL